MVMSATVAATSVTASARPCSGGVHARRAAAHAEGAVGERLVVKHGVVVGQQPVGVGHAEVKHPRVQVRAGELLQHHAQVVGVLGQGYGHGAVVGVGVHPGRDVAVVQGQHLFGHLAPGAAPQTRRQVLGSGRGVGDVKARAGAGAAPGHEAVVAARQLQGHGIAVGRQGRAALGVLRHQAPGLVKHPQSHGLDLVGKGVGPFHVHVVAEAHQRAAVAGAVVYGAVAAPQQQRQQREKERFQFRRHRRFIALRGGFIHQGKSCW